MVPHLLESNLNMFNILVKKMYEISMIHILNEVGIAAAINPQNRWYGRKVSPRSS